MTGTAFRLNLPFGGAPGTGIKAGPLQLGSVPIKGDDLIRPLGGGNYLVTDDESGRQYLFKRAKRRRRPRGGGISARRVQEMMNQQMMLMLAIGKGKC